MEGGEEYVFPFLPLVIKGVPSGCSFPLRSAIQRPQMAGSGEEMEEGRKLSECVCPPRPHLPLGGWGKGPHKATYSIITFNIHSP